VPGKPRLYAGPLCACKRSGSQCWPFAQLMNGDRQHSSPPYASADHFLNRSMTVGQSTTGGPCAARRLEFAPELQRCCC
jgi:hypothetical protein